MYNAIVPNAVARTCLIVVVPSLQDFADAEEEERAAREAEQARFSKLDEHDFGLGTSLTDGVKPKKGKGKDKGSAHESHSALIQVGAHKQQRHLCCMVDSLY